jgi:UDP-N-acetylmuramyl tripeptide synthase
MTTTDYSVEPVLTDTSTFRSWYEQIRANGLDPLIYIVGTRGKSTIARLLDTMARAEGLRTAVRTDSGVEIETRRQLGDMHPLREALDEMETGDLDLVIVEMAWGDLHSLPLNGRKPAVVICSTICPNRDYCLLDETRRAISGLKAVLLATPEETMVIADLDDSAYPSLTDLGLSNLIVTTASNTQPLLARHLAANGQAAWLTQTQLIVGTQSETHLEIQIDQIPLGLGGAALFQLRNVMMAAATALAIGLHPDSVLRGVANVHPENSLLPSSLNSFQADGVRVLIDRPNGPMFLNPLLRTVRNLRPGRVFYVLDYRDVASQDETVEVGRMIGRQAAVCLVINEHASLASIVALKAGIAQNEITPPIVHTESLAKAVMRAFSSARDDDLIVVLTSRPQTVYRTLARQNLV